jgi:hypothetical protein
MLKPLLCNPTPRISPSSRQSIRRPHDILIEEPGRPNLTRHETRAEDADEKPQGDETPGSGNQSCHGGGDSAAEQDADKDPSWTEAIA